jgi:osmotically-inducible protein OsmY
MSEWDPEREKYEPERDFRRDYVTPKLGQAERTPGRRRDDYERGVWSIGGDPRESERPAHGAHAGKGPRGYCRADMRLYQDVCDALTRDGDVDASDVEVKVENGTVLLTGTVPDPAMLNRAFDVTAGCGGVREVQNRLRVDVGPRR